MNKTLKRIIIIFSVISVLLVGGGIFAGNYLFNFALNRDQDKSMLLEAPHNAIDYDREEAEKKEELLNEWFTSSGAKDVYLTSEDGLKLHAFEVTQPESSDLWVVVAHGYTGNAEESRGVAKHFYDLGYNVLMPNARAHGESEGQYIGMGWPDRRDYVGWTKQIVENNAEAKIALYGVSMGAATVMMTSGEEDLPDNVKVVVEDCGYTSAYDEFSYQLKGIFGLPAFPFMNLASGVAKVRAGYWIKDADSIKQLQKSTTPTLFIHGDEDTFVPSYMLDEVYEAANVPKEKLLIPDAGHGGAASENPETYWSTVDAFVGKYINK